jgi:ADP-dependent NAD(P)H-hydrate dehydratase / NAD(P)H-hydrate epimerase
MDADYWHKQTHDKPLFPDMLWSRPENRKQAGKLLIIGGNVHGFSAPSEAYRAATAAGIGTARMLLPDSLRKLLGRGFDAGEFGPTTPSGSFSKLALGDALELSAWADGVLLAGDLGRNSETAIMLEQFNEKYRGQLTITKDAADYCINIPSACLARPDTLFVISLAQLQKLGMRAKFTTAITFDMDILRFVDALHEFTKLYEAAIFVKHLENIFVAYRGQVSSTRLSEDKQVWRVETAARAATWWLQNPNKTFGALTTSITSTQW